MRRNAGALFYFNLTRDVTYDYILKNPQRAGLRSTWQKMDIDRAIDAAGLKLGYSSLRKEQREAVKNFTGGNDVFLSVPTGGGKSLCYAVPLVFDQIRRATLQRSPFFAVGDLDSTSFALQHICV